MNMTDGERLITVMLADLMIAMNVPSEIDPDVVKQLVIDNDIWALQYAHPGIFSGEEGPSEEVVRETADILGMYTFIDYSIKKLPADQQADFVDNRKAWYRGFDGNHDPHSGVAHTFVDQLNRFSEYKDRLVDSHSQATLPMYRSVKEIYDHVMPEVAGDGLSYEQLKTILQ